MTDVSTTFAVVIFRVKVNCITSVDGIKLIGQLSRDVIGCLLVAWHEKLVHVVVTNLSYVPFPLQY